MEPKKERRPSRQPQIFGHYVPVRQNGIYSAQHVYRQVRDGILPPLHQRAPGCRAYLGPEHYAVWGLPFPTKAMTA